MSAERKGLMVRIPADLHAELARMAEEQGVSLNLLLVTLLAGAIGFSLKGKR
jgi:predicted HicB family RNase H-like nuclease